MSTRTCYRTTRSCCPIVSGRSHWRETCALLPNTMWVPLAFRTELTPRLSIRDSTIYSIELFKLFQRQGAMEIKKTNKGRKPSLDVGSQTDVSFLKVLEHSQSFQISALWLQLSRLCSCESQPVGLELLGLHPWQQMKEGSRRKGA